MSTPITVATSVAATPARAFALYTEPAHVCAWNAAIDAWHCPRAESDLRVGGRFSYRMEARDGSMGFDFTGTWTRIEPGLALDYTLDDDRTVEVRFEAQGEGTRVTVVFEAEASNPAEMQQAGWQAILDNYARYAAR